MWFICSFYCILFVSSPTQTLRIIIGYIHNFIQNILVSSLNWGSIWKFNVCLESLAPITPLRKSKNSAMCSDIEVPLKEKMAKILVWLWKMTMLYEQLLPTQRNLSSHVVKGNELKELNQLHVLSQIRRLMNLKEIFKNMKNSIIVFLAPHGD